VQGIYNSRCIIRNVYPYPNVTDDREITAKSRVSLSYAGVQSDPKFSVGHWAPSWIM